MLSRAIARLHHRPFSTRTFRRLITGQVVETDAYGIPVTPTWSVRELLSSYPTPTMSSATFKRLHDLSALISPAEGTPEHDTMKRELEGLVKLVEAVKLIKVDSPAPGHIPDGRIWAEGVGIPLGKVAEEVQDESRGTELLLHADRTMDGMYVVESDRTR
ncbi:hypothetical protein F5I97DRAFT_1864909 [Phlebopus sp. FC_14]|nr:hypothetical protein F5I97DRAFT_1864909 [Phlebopus sp. FC_14]